jgi:hypothetical protein
MVHYNERLETYFKSIGEKSNGLSLLHKKSQAYYSNLANYINIPVIILGTINGSISIGSGALFGGSTMSSVGVGLVALSTALGTTISSYFGWSSRSEGHRISSLSYGKLFRFLDVELALPREERMTADDLLKYVKNEFDRLAETSPMIPAKIIKMNKELFDKYTDVAIPNEMNGLEKIEVYLPPPGQAHRTETYMDLSGNNI